MRSLILISLFLSFSLKATELSPWLVLSDEVIKLESNSSFRKIPASILIESGSKWDEKKTLLRSLEKTQQSLGQCGLSLGEVRIQVIKFHPGVLEDMVATSPYHPPGILKLLKGNDLPDVRPLFFLIGRKTERSAFAMNRRAVEVYRRSHPHAGVERMLNVSLLTDHYTTNSYVPSASESYDTFAHELVHLLTNDGHKELKYNLMSTFEGPNMQTGDLVQAQCKQMENFPH